MRATVPPLDQADVTTSQQIIVDAYAKTEFERLQFLRREQDHLRADNYKDLRETIVNQDGDPRNVGQKEILPATFCGGPRYMFERQQDAMAYVRKFVRPDLFITVITNPKWPEIVESLTHYSCFGCLEAQVLNFKSVLYRMHIIFFFFFVLPAGWLLDRETRCFDEVCGTGQLLFGPVQFLGKSAIGWPNPSPQIREECAALQHMFSVLWG